MCSTTIVPPFYDLEPGAPPPLPPMLMDQLELFGNANCHLTTLIADEILVPKASIIPTARASLSTPAPEFKLAKQMCKHSDHSSSPYTKKVISMHSHSQMPSPSDSSGSLDSFSDSDSSTSSMSLSEDSKIPNPASEPGCPGRGGYTLREALDWNPKAYAKFKVLLGTMPTQEAEGSGLGFSSCAAPLAEYVPQIWSGSDIVRR
ncbi:uncharacterized protein EDB91DRAFT_1257276 [Suillus paluster]|uniref:uncharacterized protein n=1 Tax=Suillus paluster TaxID=48578 RepID=UPI001B86FE83|nr:uncharacterized protein EDB91DRAFT_1257276 [Suillus paluster]KAG1719951.1 hypothetical protein EDB91DRAFT_1257276 [Suillus paluster]